MHANVLLAADENSPIGRKSEAEIAELFHVHLQTVFTIRQRYVQQGLEDGAIKNQPILICFFVVCYFLQQCRKNAIIER
jgi:hypothetical protein